MTLLLKLFLLKVDKDQRLGSKNGISEILENQYFSGIEKKDDLKCGETEEEKNVISEIGNHNFE